MQEQAINAGNNAEELRKWTDAVRVPYDLFKAKYGSRDHDKARATTTRYEALLSKAVAALPGAVEAEGIQKALTAIPKATTHTLEQALSAGVNAKEVQDSVAQLTAPFEAFATKYRSSNREEAKRVCIHTQKHQGTTQNIHFVYPLLR